MSEVKYVCQVRLSIIRQVEFIDEKGLSEKFIKLNAESVAQLEHGSFDECEILLTEEQPA